MVPNESVTQSDLNLIESIVRCGKPAAARPIALMNSATVVATDWP